MEPKFPHAGWLASLLRRQILRRTGKPQPPRPLTLQERIAVLEPEINANRKLFEKHEKATP
jgi:hypothetical protein